MTPFAWMVQQATDPKPPPSSAVAPRVRRAAGRPNNDQRVLEFLASGPAETRAIAAAMGVERNSVSRTLCRLHERGLLKRRMHRTAIWERADESR